MNPADELALLQRHVRRIEADLALANRQMADLERRLAKMPSPAVEPVVPPPADALPPPLPPPLPPSAAESAVPVARSVVASLPSSPREFLPAEVPREPSPLRAWLTSLQLWPPAGEADAEIRLGAWWATRIGAVLAVIGVVLFGVYVSVNTPPWVKFVELLAISLAVAVAGRWWERTVPRFGAVVFAAGLALLYFCAFAGYALPAVKVIDGVASAAMWQLAAIGVLVTVSIIRRSAGIATLAVGFGYVTAIFSRAGELHAFALCTSTLLGVAAVGFHRLLRWESPSVIAMPGCYAVFALVALGPPSRFTGAEWWLWAVLLGTAILFFARDVHAVSRERVVALGERWFQGVNAGLALLVGGGVALSYFRTHLGWFYLGAAVVLSLLATLRRRQVADDPVAIILLTKASGALALAIIEVAESRTVALALLVQAWVLFFTARNLHSKALSVATGVVATAAYVFFVISIDGAVAVVSSDAVGMVLFVGGFAGLTAETARRLVAGLERRMVELIAGLALFIAGWLSIQAWEPTAWIASWAFVMATALGAVGAIRRSMGAVVAAGALVLVGHALVWYLAVSTTSAPALPGNALVVAGMSAAVGYWLGGGAAERVAGVWQREARIAAALVWALSLVTIAVVIYEVCASPLVAFAWVTSIALMLAALSPLLAERRLPWLAVWTMMVALVLWSGRGVLTGDRGVLMLALGLTWALPFRLAGFSRYRDCVRTERHGFLIEPLLVAAATLVTYRLLPWVVDPAWRTPLFALTALVIGLAGQRCGLRAAIPASWIIWLMIAIGTLGGLTSPVVLTQRLFAGFAAVMVWLPVLVFARRGRDEDEPTWTASHAASVQVALAAALGAWLSATGWRDAGQVLALMGVIFLAWCVKRLTGLASARVALVLLLGATWGRAGVLAFLGGAEGPALGMVSVLVVAIAMGALPWLVGRTTPVASVGEWQKLAWLSGSAALGLTFLLAIAQREVLAPYATVGWGVGAIVLFGAGLFVRLRPYRLVGLAGLLVCIPRVFLVDLQSAFHRIIAFVVLGAVLLWVGFSYHRFRHLIVDTKEEP